MSFGFSVGDFIAVIHLTTTIRKQLVDAPAQFERLSNHIKLLSNVLRDLDDLISERNLTSSQKTELHVITEGCRKTLSELVNRLTQYHDKGPNLNARKWLWVTYRWARDEEEHELEREIVSRTTELNKLYQNILSDVVSEAKLEAALQSLQQSQQDQQEYETIKEWLTPIDYSSQQSDLISRCQEGTGNWLLESPQFKAWLHGDTSTLFCPGIPGAGKTMITSIVVDRLSQKYQHDPDVGIAYLYCNYQAQHEQRPIDLLASLLKQLAQSRLVLPKEVRDLYNRHENGALYPSLDEISITLRYLASTFRRVFIIIDALDECQDSYGQRRRLLKEIFSLRESRMTVTSLFVTSRFTRDAAEAFRGIPTLEIRATEEDLQGYLSQQIAQLPVWVLTSPALQMEIMEKITAAADGMFLLAKLHMESLADMPHAKALRRALDKLPMGLDQAYQSAMERIESQRRSYRYFAKQVLSWITFALRPLNASELQHALAVEDGDSTFDSDSVLDPDIIVSACAGLVIHDQASNIIRLVHYSTKEYFEQTRMHWFPEQYFAETCLTYLSFDAFKTGSCQSDDELKDRLNSYPFLNYAANYWGEHISGNHSPHARKLAKALLSNSGLLSSMIQIIHSPSFRFPGYSQRFPRHVSGLHIAALFGLLRVTEHLLEDGVEIDDCNNYYGTPLQAAAAEGHSDVVEFLLDRDAKIDATGGRYDGAIQAAAYGGHVKVIEVLLNRGADPNTMLNGRSNALHVAASNGHTAVVNTLLAAGADINARDGEFGRTALARAAWNGHESVVTCLLKSKFAKPDINALDHQDCSALHLALEKHHEAIVNILIDSRARMDVANQQQKTPAQIALQDIRRIDPSNFEFNREKSNKLKRGVQAQVEVMKRKGSQNARQEKYSFVLRKRFSPDFNDPEGYVTRLTREREALRDLNHPNIVKFLAYDEKECHDVEDDQGYRESRIYMEYCEGGDLRKYVKPRRQYPFHDLQSSKGPSLTPHEAWSILADLASALAYCHHGLFKDEVGNYSLKEEWEPRLHRDIKPENIVMSTSEQFIPVAKLCDLGLAKVWDGGRDYQTRKVGTVEYSPKEVEKGEPWTIKGDIYSLGATIQALRIEPNDSALQDLLTRCQESENPSRRPSCFKILQIARENLLKFPGAPAMTSFIPYAPPDLDYMSQAVLETLKRLFGSYDISYRKRTNSTASRIQHLIWDGSKKLLQKLDLENSVDLAIILQDEEKAVKLISNGCARKSPHWDGHGITSLHLACLEGLELVAEALVKHDPILLTKQTTRDKSTPLHWAVENGQWKMCILLLRLKTELEEKNEGEDSTWHTSQNALHIAAETRDESSLRRLLKTEDNEPRNKWGRTPLHYAAFNGDVAVVELLLESGAVADAEDDHGRSPLMLAANQGHTGVVEKLLGHTATNVNLSNRNSMCPLNQALFRGHLHTAKILLNAGANPRGRDRFGHAPMFIASARNLQLVDLLLDAHADIMEDLVGGNTIVHLAAHAGNIDLLDRLLSLNPDLDVDLLPGSKVKGDSPLSRAIGAQHEETVRLLLSHGANPNFEMETTWTCFLQAAKIGNLNILKLMLSSSKEKVDIQATCMPEKWTALHIACQEGHEPIVEFLLKCGCDVDARDCHEATPLHLAAKFKHVRVVEMLIQHKVDLDAKWKPEEWTPVHIACQGGCLAMLKLLLEAGASIDALDVNKKTPLDFATAAKHQDVVQFLEEQRDRMPGPKYSWDSD